MSDLFDPNGMFSGPEPARPRPRSASGTAVREPEHRSPVPRHRPAARRPAGRRPAPRPIELRPPAPRPAARRAPTARRRPPAGGATHRRRPAALLGVLVLLFGAVVARLAQLQVVDHDRLVELGEAQVVRSVALPGDRGSILDRNGDELAISLTRPTVWADPRHVEDPAATAAALAPVLGVDAATLEERLDGPGAFAYLARQVEPAVADRVEELDLPGVHLLEEPARYQPAGDLARSVLGDVDVDGVGISGLELQHDELLAGEPGRLVLERDLEGRTIPQGERQVDPAVPGSDLVLTIDRGMQHVTEQALSRVDARGASAIVMNPQTGEVYALANMVRPEDGGPLVPTGANHALVSVFEPGSVNKVITMAAALEEGVVTPTSYLEVPDSLQVSDKLFRDHDPHPTESWTPTDILATSSNVGTILLARQLGAERLDEYLRRFGFGERTAIGFPAEQRGLLLDPEDWSGTSIGSIPLGQGLAVTAMQMLAAYNVIATGGEYVPPRLVAATVDAGGARHEVAPGEPRRRVVSEATARAVRDMLVAVVEHGTGTAAAIDGYTVAGKTGTARKPLEEHVEGDAYKDLAGNYHYVATFAGFVPAEDPQLSVIVVVDEPRGGFYASEVAAPVFAEIARWGLRHFRIPPAATPFRSSVPAPTAVAEG